MIRLEYLDLLYLLPTVSLVSFHLAYKVDQLLNEAVGRASDAWRTYPRRQNQFILVTTIAIAYILFTVVTTFIFPAVVTGSLLGAFPLLIFEANKYFSSPYVVVSEVNVVRYPDKWFVFGPKDEDIANGGICVHVKLVNEGRKTAKSCAVHLRSSAVDDQGYPVRWTEGNALEKDIAPNEIQEIDLFWIDYDDGLLKTGDPNRDEDEEHYPPGSYNWIPHHEISEGEQSFSVTIRGKNMEQREFPIEIFGKEYVDPKELFNKAEDWGVIQRIKEYDEDYAILYRRDRNDDILEVPFDMQLGLLGEQGGEFDPQSILDGDHYDYEQALREKYDVRDI